MWMTIALAIVPRLFLLTPHVGVLEKDLFALLGLVHLAHAS
jgi:hypothetical protein